MTAMIEPLRDLRQALDQAIAALEPVLPALAAWRATPGEPVRPPGEALCTAPGCGAPFVPRAAGVPQKFCSTACRARAHREIRKAVLPQATTSAELDPGPLPDEVDRPFRGHAPFDSSDPDVLRPPSLPWEQSGATSAAPY